MRIFIITLWQKIFLTIIYRESYTKLHTTFQNKKRTFKWNVFLRRFYLPFILQGYGWTLLLHQGVQKQPFANLLQNRCSRRFWKIPRKTSTLESLFNKVGHFLFYDICEILKNIYLLITPQHQTRFICKPISKVT